MKAKMKKNKNAFKYHFAMDYFLKFTKIMHIRGKLVFCIFLYPHLIECELPI